MKESKKLFLNLILLSVISSLNACIDVLPITAPQLIDIAEQVYPINTAIPSQLIKNANAGEISSCSADDLPVGLMLEMNADSTSCLLSGKPTQLQDSQLYAIKAENSAGSSSINIAIAVSNIAPVAVAGQAESYTIYSDITPLAINNNGGHALTQCVNASELPLGLSVAVSANQQYCELSGQPIQVQAAQMYDIWMANDEGYDKASISIAVTQRSGLAPVLENIELQALSAYAAIIPLIFINNDGSGGIVSCVVNTPLPLGMLLAPTDDGTSCEISGTPSEIKTASTYSVTASNAQGQSTATISLSVSRDVSQINLTLEPIKTLAFSWGAAAGVNHYNLLEDINAEGSFITVIAFENTVVDYDYVISLTAQLHAQYQLQSCYSDDDSDCLNSEIIAPGENLAQAIGIFSPLFDNYGNRNNFGSRIVMSGDGQTLAIASSKDDSNAVGINGQTDATSVEAASVDSGAVSLYRMDHSNNRQWLLHAYIKAEEVTESLNFATALAISQQGDVLAVGVEMAGGGQVYVFELDTDDNWIQKTILTASNAEVGDDFGTEVKLSDDGNTLLVGAPNEDGIDLESGLLNDDMVGDFDAGAAYVFNRDSRDGEWMQTAYLKPFNPTEDGSFAYALDISGDGLQIAVSAFQERSSVAGINSSDIDNQDMNNSGAVYVYRYDVDSNSWPQTDYIKAAMPHTSAWFGISLALNEDGRTLAVGSNRQSSEATGINGDESLSDFNNSGAVYVFSQDADSKNWRQEAFIKTDQYESSQFFGQSVALSADGNTLAAGAHFESGTLLGLHDVDDGEEGGSVKGAAFLFLRDDINTWQQSRYIKAAAKFDYSYFGYDVSLSDDAKIMAVGATGSNNNGHVLLY